MQLRSRSKIALQDRIHDGSYFSSGNAKRTVYERRMFCSREEETGQRQYTANKTKTLVGTAVEFERLVHEDVIYMIVFYTLVCKRIGGVVNAMSFIDADRR